MYTFDIWQRFDSSADCRRGALLGRTSEHNASLQSVRSLNVAAWRCDRYSLPATVAHYMSCTCTSLLGASIFSDAAAAAAAGTSFSVSHCVVTVWNWCWLLSLRRQLRPGRWETVPHLSSFLAGKSRAQTGDFREFLLLRPVCKISAKLIRFNLNYNPRITSCTL